MERQKLSKIVEYKSFRKDILEMEMKKAQDALESAQEDLYILEDALRKGADEFRKKSFEDNLSPSELELFHHYFQHCKRQIDRQEKVVLERINDLESKREIMLEAYREKRIFEILHDRALIEEIREADKTEQKEIDFLYLTRKKMESGDI